jgi:hypothetical protein
MSAYYTPVANVSTQADTSADGQVNALNDAVNTGFTALEAGLFPNNGLNLTLASRWNSGSDVVANKSDNGMVTLSGFLGTYTGTGLGHYANFPGSAGNYLSSADTGLNSPTGTIDGRFLIAPDDWTPAADQVVCAKWGSAGNLGFRFQLAAAPAGYPVIVYSSNGTASASVVANAAPPAFVNTEPHWMRFYFEPNNGAGGKTARFYWTDSYDEVNHTGSWTQIGTDVTSAGTTSIFDGNSPIELASILLGTANHMPGKIYRAVVFAPAISSVYPVIDCDPNEYVSGNSWVSRGATGATWNINTSGGSPLSIVQNGNIIGTLPVGYRPAEDIYIPNAVKFDNDQLNYNQVLLKITTAGVVSIVSTVPALFPNQFDDFIRIHATFWT